MIKQVYELTPADLEQFSVWVFPMDETVIDEESVRPVMNESEIEDHQIIVKSIYTDKKGKKYFGYIYWGQPTTVDYIKPVIFFDEHGEKGLLFWNGMVKPADVDFDQARDYLDEEAFPIHFESVYEFGLEPIKGILEGIYYIDQSGNILLKRMPV